MAEPIRHPGIIRSGLNFVKRLPPFLWILALSGLFWAVAYVSDFFVLHEVVSAMYIGVAAAVVVVFGWTALIAGLTIGGMDRGQQVALGIALSWLGNEAHRIYHLWWRSLGEPLDIINNDFVTFTLVLTVIGGVLHITVPSTHSGLVPRTSWLVLGAAVMIGAAVAGFIVGEHWSPAPGAY